MTSSTLEEYELLGDAKYRSFIGAVDKAVKSFEYTSEWADLISALGKLNKVLLSHLKFSVIPRRITISKRLAQCMHPALPSGVHLKALETYDIIFKCIGTARLSQELFIYSAGLFPLLAHAAMNVRPVLLTVYENHFVPLGERLRPGLNGFLIGVLPGLEEGSDCYDRTDSLLMKVCESVEKSYFYGCLWRCILGNATIQLPAITFITAHFDKKLSMEDQLYIIGTDIDSMVQGMCAALQINNVLVQRSALDLLILGFPMHNSQLVHSDMVKIVTSAITVVLRRDMSLNRRLFAWLLGSELSVPAAQIIPDHVAINRCESVTGSDSGFSTAYFDSYSKDLLLEALQICFEKPSSLVSMALKGQNTAFAELWPYRILISLLDRPEISYGILDDILVDVFRSVYKEIHLCDSSEGNSERKQKLLKSSQDKLSRNKSELIKNVNLLFDTFESYYLWEYIGKLYAKACESRSREHSSVSSNTNTGKQSATEGVKMLGGGNPSVEELCLLVSFLLDVVNVETYMDTPSEHLPDLLTTLGTLMIEHCSELTLQELSISFQLCSKILSKVQPATLPRSDELSCFSSESRSRQEPIPNIIVPLSDEEMIIQTTVCVASLSSEDLDVLQPQSVVSRCIATFQEFFTKFVRHHLLLEPDAALLAFSRILVLSDKESLRQRDLENLLQHCVVLDRSDDVVSSEGKKEDTLDELLDNVCLACKCTDTMLETFRFIAQFLVELASFPVLCSSANLIPTSNGTKEECTYLPEWVQLALVLGCFTDEERLHAIALQMILDLILITKSVLKATDKALDRPKELVTEVLMVPMIQPSELLFMWHKTIFFSLAATRLWRQIGNSSMVGDQLRIVELLQQVHNLALSDSVCDSVICKTLVTYNLQNPVNAHKKFCILWHLTRDLRLKTGSARPFDRPLFLMLDNLRREIGPEKTIAEGWLNHCLQRGDIPRILEPILLILLHPDTARVSVQHISICRPRKKKTGWVEETEECTLDTQIYAISSVGGNVIYHVNDESRHSSRTASPDRRILALTSLIPSESQTSTKIFTCNSMLNDYEIPCSHERTFSSPISVFVNPFGSMTSFGSDSHHETTVVPDFSNVKRMNYKTSHRGSFDDSDGDSESKKNTEGVVEPSIQDDAEEAFEDKLEHKEVFGVKPEVFEEKVEDKESSFEKSLEKEGSIGRVPSTETLVEKETAIEEYVKELLNEIITSVIEGNIGNSEVTLLPPGQIEMDDVFSELDKTSIEDEHSKKAGTKYDDSLSGIHPLHTYLLLYCQVYDSQRTLYALTSFQSVVLTNSRVALWSMATTSINNSLSFRSQELQMLLAKHRKSVFGNNFHGDLSNEAVTMYRSNMLLEVVVTTCLYYVRSFYPNLLQVRLTDEEVLGNQRVRLLSVEVLTLVFSELIGISRDSGKGFASYLRDLLSRCKVQKIVLHCLIAAVYNSQQKKNEEEKSPTFSKVIVDFNEKSSGGDKPASGNSFQDTLEVLLIRLLSTLIILEDTVSKYGTEETLNHKISDSKADKNKSNQQSSVKYNQGVPIPLQPMFLTTVLNAFRQKYKSHLHIHWLALVMTTLPFIGQSLKHLVVSIVSQLCLNLDMLAQQCQDLNSNDEMKENDVTPDYIITLIEGLTTICHYCLLDNPTPINTIQFPSFPSQSYASGINASQILSNLIHAFSTSGLQKDQNSNGENIKILEGVLAARRTLLSNLPRILNTMANMWQIVSLSEVAVSPKEWWIMGSPRAVRQHILSFLSPISVNHGSHFMAAVAVVWHDYRHKGNVPIRKIIPPYSREQLLLVELIGAIKVLPMESIVQTVRQVVRQPPVTSADRNQKRVSIEVNMLQFFLAYMQNSLGNQLMESWNSLLSLWRDGLQLSALPSVQFHLLALLHEFVQKIPLIEDRKSSKDLQEVAQKLIDACSVVAGSSLEQTTWLRRNLAVKPGPQQTLPDDNDYFDKPEENASSQPSVSLIQNAQYSVQALHVLAEFLAPVLDVVYASEEKEKMVSLLNNIMYYVTPYLRNHSLHNAPSFRACCQLLASISGYQYTRKAWKKDAFELLLDPSFFQMDSDCMGYWMAIIDHLMTHDKTTFRDFLARVYMPQSGSLNLFSSKDQEYELRSQLLKRLAFVIFCSEPDQYQKYMPDIQERLADCLRLPQVPSVQSHIFLCFRVLLLRMSAEHITSLWPVIITEMVQVFLQMEQELSTDTEEFRGFRSSHIRRLSALDTSWVVNSHNGLHAHNHPVWLQLYLAVCKLLDMVVCLPEDMLPQFQMYRWAFVADSPPVSSDSERKAAKTEGIYSLDPNFVPHIVRLATLMNFRVPNSANGYSPRQPPLLTMTTIKSLMDLHDFFTTLASCNSLQTVEDKTDGKCSPTKASGSQSLTSILKKLEQVLETDFIELRLAR